MSNIIKHEILYNLSQKGTIKGYKWINDNQNNKAIVVISHGMAEHIDRYEEFANKLCDSGYIVFGHNHRGHKDSILTYSDYGYMSDEDNFSILVSDLHEIINKVKEEYPDLPIYLFGHSMGSYVSQRFAQLYGNMIQGVILSGSSKNPNLLVKLGMISSKIIMEAKGRRYRSRFIDRLAFGTYNSRIKNSKTEFDWLSRDEAEVNKYIEDKYCGGVFTVSFFYDLSKGFKEINQNFDLIPKRLPILIISGEKDPVGGYGKYVTNLYNTLREKEINDIEMILYKDARHELFKEFNKLQTYLDIIKWLNKCVSNLENHM